MESKKNRKRRKKRIERKIILILCTSLSLGAVFITMSKFVGNKENTIVNAEENSKKNGDEEKNKKEEKVEENENIEIIKIDNSGYLSFEDDPNAEDAMVVSENINALLTGIESYPVRTDGKKVVYLTFDDGPSTTNTPEVLNILEKYNIKGTFFVLGKSIEKDENSKKILKDIVEKGHAIGNHTYSHNYQYLYPNRIINVDNFMKDIEKNNELLKSVLGKDFFTRVIRFPGGYWSWNGREEVKERLISKGYLNIDWNALNGDSDGSNKNYDQLLKETQKTVEDLGPNTDNIVLLMHDTYGKEETVKSLPHIIEYFQGEGFEFKSMK